MAKNFGNMAMGFAKSAMSIFKSNSSDNQNQTKDIDPVIEAFLNTEDNRVIIDNTNKLYSLADEFGKTLSTKDKNNLVLQVIRYSKYNDEDQDL